MNKIETWAAANRTAIEQYVKDRNYLELIQFFCMRDQAIQREAGSTFSM